MSKGRKRSLLEKLIALLVINAFSFNILVLPVLANPSAAAADANGPNVREQNGTTIVDIVAANQHGVSHNKFDKFDVNNPGLILNNIAANQAYSQLLQAQLAANGKLGGQAANLILAEVTGSGRTNLNGPLEIAGQRADLIIANPNGISGSGFGFINADRVTLTTGVPVFDQNNNLSFFDVTRGSISLAGQDLDENGYNYQPSKLDILARAVEINTEIWAEQEINVVTGTNRINYDNLNIEEQLAATAEQEKPSLALDVGALGGMYSGKIRLVGTEAGLGVAIAGDIAAEKDLVLDSQGKITLLSQEESGEFFVGALSAKEGITITTREDFVNAGVVESNDFLAVSAVNVKNDGMLLAGVKIDEDDEEHEDHEDNHWEVEFGKPADLTIAAAGSISGSGLYKASKNIVLDGAAVSDNRIGMQAEKLFVNGRETSYNSTGQEPEKPVDDSDDPDLSDPLNGRDSNLYELPDIPDLPELPKVPDLPDTPDMPDTPGTKLVAVEKEANLDLLAAGPAAGGSMPIIDKAANGVDLVQIATAGSDGVSRNYYQAFNINPTGLILNNSTAYTYTQLGGYIDRNNMLGGISARVILNEVTGGGISRLNGFLEVAGTKADVVIANQNGIVVNGFGYINAGNASLITAGNFTVQGAGLNAKTTENLYINAGKFTNTYSELWGKNVYVNSASTLTNTGKIISEGEMQLVAENIQNSDGGLVLSRDDMLLLAEESLLNQSGMLQSEKNLTISTHTLANQNQAAILGGQDTILLSERFTNSNNAAIITERDLYLQADDITNQNQAIIKAGRYSDFIGETFANTNNSAIEAGKDIYLQVKDLQNHGKSVIIAGENATFISDTFANSDNSAISTGQDIYVSAEEVINQDNSVLKTDGKATFLSETFTNSNSSAIIAGKDIYVQAAEITNQQGSMLKAGGDADFSGENFANQANSAILAGRDLYVQAEQIANRNNSVLSAGRDGAFIGETFLNSGKSALSVEQDVYLQAGEIKNLDGSVVKAGQDAELRGETFANSEGSALSAGQDLYLEAQAALTNQNSSVILAGRDAAFLTQDLANLNNSAISAGRDASLSSTSLSNQGDAVIMAGQDAAFATDSFLNSGSAAISAGQDVYLLAKQATNQQDASILAGQDFLAQVEGNFSNLANSAIFADHDLYLEAGGKVDNNDSILFSGNDLTIIAAGIDNTHNSLIYAVGDLGLQATGDILNQSSNIESQQNIKIFARNLTNEKEIFETEWVITYQPISYSIQHLQQANYYAAMRSFIREIKTGKITQETATAKILAEGSINIQVDNDFTNHYSVVSAVEDLLVYAGNKIENYGYQGTIIFEDTGSDYHYWKYKKHKRWHTSCKMVYGTTIIPYYHWEENATNVSRHGILSGGGTVKLEAKNVVNEIFNAGGETPVIAGGIENQTTYATNVGRNLGSSIGGSLNLGDLDLGDQTLGNLKLDDKRFSFSNDPEAKYLIETDPRFANYKNFLSSDYLFERIVSDHEKVMKRLGDGYYEQMLITEQITNLTGRKYLSGYSSELEQYKALMDNAVMVAEEFNLTIGVALTAEQIAALTTDIVWFVEEIINGEAVLVPYVYLSSLRADDLTQGGAIILGNDVQIFTKDKLENVGTIKADNKLLAYSDGDIINRGGTLQGQEMYLGAGHNIENLGGLITGGDITLQAENIINKTTTNTVNYRGLEQTTISQGAGIIAENNLTLQAENQVLNQGAVLSAGEDLNISAKDVIIESVAEEYRFATVQGEASTSLYEKVHSGSVVLAENLNINADDVTIKGSVLAADNDLNIKAENNLNILADKDIYESDLSVGSRGGSYFDRSMENHETVSGSLVSAGNDISLEAGRDLTIKGSDVQSDEGKVSLRGDNVNILEETERHESLREHQQKSSGLLSSKSTKIYDYQSVDYVVGSSVTGQEIEISSANDTNIRGSLVLADEDLNINAGGNINIESAQQNSESYYKKEVKKSGFLSGGGLGFSIGSEKEKLAQTTKNVEQVGSMVGSLGGNVNLDAGNDVNIRASDIFAGQDINIEGNSVNIESADHIYNFNSKYEYKKTGLTVSLSGNTINAFNNIYQPLQRAAEAKTDQLKTMGTLKSGWSAYQAYKSGLFSGNALTDRNLRVSLAFGSTKITSEANAVTTIAQGSSISAGGDVNIKAREKDINIIGSNIAGENVTLEAKENVNIQASANTNTSSSDSNSSSSSIGVNVGINSGFGGGIGVEAGYSKNTGEVRENGTTWNESTITANDKLTIKSGEDTNIIGSQVKGDRVEMEVGRDLNIESLQDTEKYRENNKSKGGNISSNLGKGSKPSGQLGSQNQNINSDYASVQEQAGIYAGEGGFDIYVEGNTDLKGAVIASEADAEDNKLSTGTLTYSDIENHAEYEANTKGNSIGMKDGNVDLLGSALGAIGGSVAGSDGEASSTTHSAIAEGEIEIRDNPDQDISDLSRDTDNANNPLNPIFDRDKVLEKQEAAAYFGEVAFGLIGDISKRMNWGEGSAEKILLHGLIAGLMAEINGGSFGDGLTVGMINEMLIGVLDKNREALNLSDDAIKAISNLVGQAVGGNQGGAIAESATANNYLKHAGIYKYGLSEADAYEKDLKDCGSDESCKEAVRKEYKALSDANIDAGAQEDRSGNYIMYNELYNEHTNVPSDYFGHGTGTDGNYFISQTSVEDKIRENLANMSDAEKIEYINAVIAMQDECGEKNVRMLLYGKSAEEIIDTVSSYNEVLGTEAGGMLYLSEQQKKELLEASVGGNTQKGQEKYNEIIDTKYSLLYNHDTDMQQYFDNLHSQGLSNEQIVAAIESGFGSIESISENRQFLAEITLALALDAPAIISSLKNGGTILQNTVRAIREGGELIPKNKYGSVSEGTKNLAKAVIEEQEAMARSTNWLTAEGKTFYPPNRGAMLGTEEVVTLQPGQTLGRYGEINTGSKFVTEAGATPESLSLVPGTNTGVYYEIEVLKPIPGVNQSKALSWFDQPGGGLQYDLPMTLNDLLAGDYIRIVTK